MVREIILDYEDYYERLDKHLVKANYNIGLNFSEGYVFFRVARTSLLPYLYDPFAEITNFAGAGNIDMPSGTYITAKELPSVSLNSTNILKVDDQTHVYQVFFGVAPSVCRVFVAYPRETEINQIDEGIHTPAYPAFGFYDGFESPLNMPSPRTGRFIPYGPLMAFAFYNYAPYNIKPMLRFIINRMQVEPIKDARLIKAIIDRKVECTFASVGGVDSPYKEGPANIRKYWGVDALDLLATPQEIAAAVAPK